LFIGWVIFHCIVCVALILVVLLQSSKGEGLAGSAFGGGQISGAVFGGRGAATFLSKATSVLAVVFMLNCAVLAFMSSTRSTGGTVDASQPAESAVTRQAQAERDEAMRLQHQQQQMAQPVDTAGGVQFIEQTPTATPTEAPAETPPAGEQGGN